MFAVASALALATNGYALVDPARAAEATANVWITTADGSKKLAKSPEAVFSSGPQDIDVEVDAGARGQRFTGAGASLTEASAHLISALPDTARKDVLHDLFSRDGTGIGLDFLRQPFGGNDFVSHLPNYSYEDVKGAFSVDRDKKEILPLLRSALKINPDIEIMASPWSAPGWMKDSGRLDGGRLSPEHHEDYADYLVRAIEAYREAGVPVDDLTAVNEPLFEAIYPSMAMSSGQQAEFFRVLDKKLTAAGLDTRLFAFDHNWDHPEYPLDVLNRTSDIKRVQGASVHCYRGEPEEQWKIREAGERVLFTECSGTDGENGSQDFAEALTWQTKNWVIRPLRAGSETVVLWNLALDPDGGPTFGFCRDCNGVVEVDGDTVHKNAEYYTLGHVSKFVDRGARLIGSATRGSEKVSNVTFENPDGVRVSVVLNADASAHAFSVTENGHSFSYELPAGSVATFTWPEESVE